MLPPEAVATSNFEFLNLMFMKSLFDREAVWLLGIYVKLVWSDVICKKKILKQKTLENECSLQYFKQNLVHIVGLRH